MIRRPPRSTRTDTLCPDTTLFRSVLELQHVEGNRYRVDMGVPRLEPADVPFTAAARADRYTLTLEQGARSEEHTSELQSLMRISYAVFCLKKKNKRTDNNT